MHDRESSWIKAGIKVLARTGKIELRELCREHGKAMSSFYNVYPNNEDSRGMDRYTIDLLQYHRRIIGAFFEQMNKIFIDYDLPIVIDEVVNKLIEFWNYNAFSARIRNLAETGIDPVYIEYWERISKVYLQNIKLFYEIHGIPEDLILDEHEMRLIFDGFLMLENEEFITDSKSIINARLNTRESGG